MGKVRLTDGRLKELDEFMVVLSLTQRRTGAEQQPDHIDQAIIESLTLLFPSARSSSMIDCFLTAPRLTSPVPHTNRPARSVINDRWASRIIIS